MHLSSVGNDLALPVEDAAELHDIGVAELEELLGCRKYSAVILNALRLIPPAGCLAASAILDCFFLLPAAVVTLYFINEYR